MSEITTKKNLRMNLFNSIFLLTVSKGLTQLLFFVLRYVALINWLDTDQLADLIIYFRYLELFQSLIIIGAYVFPKFIAEEKHDFSQIIFTGFLLILVNFVLISLGFVLYFHFSNVEILTAMNSDFLVFLLSGSFMLIMQKEFEFIFLGLRKNSKIFLSNLILSIIYGILCTTFVLGFEWGILGAIAAYLLANMGSLIFYLAVFIPKIRSMKQEKKISKEIGKKLISFSLPLFVGGILYFINFRVNSLFLRSVDVDFLIYYDTGLSLILYLIGFIGVPIQDAIFPYLTKSLSDNKIDEVKIIIADTMKIISVVFISAILIFYFSVDLIYSIVYPSINSLEFVFITRVLLLGAIFYIFNQFFGRIPSAAGKSLHNLYAQIIGAGLNICFLIIFILTQEEIFMLLGFLASTFGMTVYYLAISIKILKIPFKELFAGQIIIVFFAIIGMFELLTQILHLNVILSGLLSIAMYFVIFILIKFLNIADFHELKRFISDLLKNQRKK